MTPSGIEPATFRFVAQHLNHCATAVTNGKIRFIIYYEYYYLHVSVAVTTIIRGPIQKTIKYDKLP